MDYKSTLNLPKTEFPMKADLPHREPLFFQKWQEMDIYRLIRKKSLRHPKYVLHDGPPYANGDIHIGHSLNKTLKDIIVKLKTMQGFDSPYIPGWDCHGLPIEHQLFKELGINKYQIKQEEFRKKAYEYALKYVSTQKEQFKRLGVFGDWENPYLTLSLDYEAAIVGSFRELVKQGYIYRGLKPVNWCFKCETALAEAEVEYENHTSPSIYVKFKLEPNPNYNSDTYLLIWTTTPWTLIGNVAVSVHPDFAYSYVETNQGNLILAKELLPAVFSLAGITEYETLKEFSGRELEGLVYEHPFGLRKGRVVLAEYVSKDEGSGLVHTAPGHGNEDYLTGIKYKLDMVMPVDDKGNFDETAGEFKGLNVYRANPLIIQKLGSLNTLLLEKDIEHSYPHCWRCKSPIIYRATKQWFLRLEHKGLRKRLLEAINNEIKWIPAAGKERILAMVELRPDWCLSRQRYWGVPIPAIVCQKCKEEILDLPVIDNFIQSVRKVGTDSWFKKDIKEFLPHDFKCPYCQHNEFSKGTDILDVWFDSGVSHQAVLKNKEELEFPCALYLEGSDQHRGWFQSSLIPSVCIDGKPPFKAVLTHGFVVDGKGQKMSKSLGNVISPFDIIKTHGADILRLWAASSDYNEDIRISTEILSRLSESYRKVRNTVKFILSNLYDFNPKENRQDYAGFRKIDQWVLYRLNIMLDAVNKAYDSFEFYKAYKYIYDFCNEDLSMYYLDMVKGRLYTYAANSRERRSAQTVIYDVLNVLVRLIAPIFTFTAEEIWQHIPKADEDASILSAHLLDWPKAVIESSDIAKEMTAVMELIPSISKALEEKRGQGLIGSSFDAQIIILTNDEIRYKYLGSLGEELNEIFKASRVLVEKKDDVSGFEIVVAKAAGNKCARCWNYSDSVGRDNEHPLICAKCQEAVNEKQDQDSKKGQV